MAGRGRPGDVKSRQFWESAKYNNATFQTYFDRLTELSISMFKWKNLPDTLDERFLELALFGDGRAVFFKDEVMGFLALRCMVGGIWSVYNIPTDRTAYASNGYQDMLKEKNMQGSMSRPGCPYDNSCVESFFASLKKEKI